MKLININSKIFLILILKLLVITQCQNINFKHHLRRLDEYCLTEYFPDKTLIIYKIISDSSKIRCQLKLDEEVIESKVTGEFNYPFTSKEGGDYMICITNYDIKDAEVNLSIEYGVGARDYSSVAKTKDLKPIDLALQKLSDRAFEMSRLISYSRGHENIFENYLDELTSKLVINSSIVMICMIVVGYVETLFLRNFMRRRKLV